MFDNIFNWKLLSGSHKFPGPDGGTCITEAAIIAAGFPYRAIQSYRDCPPCFSVVISTYCINLNDRMPDTIRQKLVPFIVRLSGSADSREVEQERLWYIINRTKCEITADAADAADYAADDAAYAAYATSAASADAADDAAYAAYAADAASATSADAADDADDAAIWKITLSILDGALKIGNQAPQIENTIVNERLNNAKQLGQLATV